jgi:peptidoglycan/xylan/chitin deacetylase (PgdA/CDA1 family)
MKRVFVAPATLVALGMGVFALGGCQFLPGAKTATAPTPAPTPTPVPLPKIDYAKVRPNELGVIPVIMYHEVKGTKDDDKYGLTRSLASFRQDLEVLRKANFYPVNLGDVVNGVVEVPAGKSPVVLTFDDARPSQFQLNETAESYKVAPDCAVGIMEEFAKQNPKDWALRGTFFVLPKSKVTIEPFGQAGLGDQKMAYLVKQGFEIGNHSTHHRSFRGYTPAQIQEEVGNANKVIMAGVPTAKIRVIALPMGVFPRDKKNWQYLLKGTYGGVSYQYDAAFLAAWRPMPSPASKEYDPLRLERINAINTTNGIRDWVKKLTTGGAQGMALYVSDGDPNTVSYPKAIAAQANTARIEKQGRIANAYETAGGGAKPIAGRYDPDDEAARKPVPRERETTDFSPPGSRTATDLGNVVIRENRGGNGG